MNVRVRVMISGVWSVSEKKRAMSLRAPEARPVEAAHGASRLAAVLAAGMARLGFEPTGGKKKEGSREYDKRDGSGQRPGGGIGGPRQLPEDRRKSKALKEDAERYMERLRRGLTPYEQGEYAEVRELAKRSAASQRVRRQRAADANQRNELEEGFVTHEELDAWLQTLREADDATMDAILEGLGNTSLAGPPPEMSSRERVQRMDRPWRRVKEILRMVHDAKNASEAEEAAASLRVVADETEAAAQRAKGQGDATLAEEWDQFKAYMANWDEPTPPAAPREEVPQRVVVARPTSPEEDDLEVTPDEEYFEGR